LFFLAAPARSQSGADYCRQASLMTKTILIHHYQPHLWNEQSSEKLFIRYMKTLDPGERFFTMADMQSLESFKYRLGEEIKSQSCAFVDQVIRLYRRKLMVADSLVSALLEEAPDYTREDTMIF